MTINRRALLGLGTAAAVTALTTFSRGAPALAQSGGYKLIRHGHVLTLDPTLGEIPDGDVLILDDEIVDVGSQLSLPGGQGTIIEADGMVVAPGLIDNHRHMWGTLLRGFSGDHTFGDYFGQVLLTISPLLTTDDVYLGCLLGAY